MCLFDPLRLDTADGNDKANQQHGSDDREDKGKMRKICGHPKVIVRQHRRRANPAQIVEVPDATTAKSNQLRKRIPSKPQIPLIDSKNAEEERK
jgi:hypothetical protein